MNNFCFLEPFKKRIAEALNEDKAIFTEDLKTLLHLVRNDTDLELLVKLLKRWVFKNKNNFPKKKDSWNLKILTKFILDTKHNLW